MSKNAITIILGVLIGLGSLTLFAWVLGTITGQIPGWMQLIYLAASTGGVAFVTIMNRKKK